MRLRQRDRRLAVLWDARVWGWVSFVARLLTCGGCQAVLDGLIDADCVVMRR